MWNVSRFDLQSMNDEGGSSAFRVSMAPAVTSLFVVHRRHGTFWPRFQLHPCYGVDVAQSCVYEYSYRVWSRASRNAPRLLIHKPYSV